MVQKEVKENLNYISIWKTIMQKFYSGANKELFESYKTSLGGLDEAQNEVANTN